MDQTRPPKAALPPAPGRWALNLWPYAVLTMLALMTAAPLANADLPCSDDAPFHLYRAVELGRLIELGHFIPRWAPHMALGYGYPFFNFYAPLSSYLVVALHGLAGLAYPAALKISFGLGIWLAGLGAFWFARALWGPRAGVAAGAAYLLTPYLAYDVLFRGNLAESAAFVWPPLVLWALHTALDGAVDAGPTARGRVWAAALAAAAYAALILTHNIFALIASPLFAGYVVLRAWQARSARKLLLGTLSLAAGIGLTTYFWLPAVVERAWVHSDRLLVPPIFTWYTNFISARELLALPRAEDPQLINPSPARGVGAVTALLCLPALAAVGLGAARRRQPRGERHATRRHTPATVGFFAAALAGYAFLTLPASAPVWQLIKPLELVQFPWRMLGPAALCSAVLIAAGVDGVEQWLAQRAVTPAAHWLRALPLAVAGASVFFASLAAWYPRYCASPHTAGVAELVQYERETNTIGTTAKGEYLPRTAEGVPPDMALAEALMQGQEPARLRLPVDGGEMTSPVPPDPLDATYQVTARRDLVAVYQQFYYPGWMIAVDGEPVATRAVPAGEALSGLIAFDLPAGTHSVRARFGSTPLRTGANLASGLMAGGWLALGLWTGLWARAARAQRPATAAQAGGPAAGLVAFFTLLVIVKLAVIDRVPNPLRRPALDARALPLTGTLGQVPLLLDFAGGIRLHGYDLSATRLPADGAVDAVLYVSRWAASEARYWPAFRVEDAAGLTWHDPDYLPPRWHREPPPTGLWPLDQNAQWARRLALLPGTPPGTYTLTGEVFDLDSLQIASVLDAGGNPVAPRVALGTLIVGRPRRPWRLQPANAGARPMGPITLLGYDVSHPAANAGDTVLLTLYWRSQTQAASDELVRLSLTSAGASSPALVMDIAPVSDYGLTQWQPGDEWRGQHRLRLPATLPSGDYDLALQAGSDTAGLGRLRVTAPQRTFVAPESEIPVGVAFEGVGNLAGYTLTRAQSTLAMTLVWHARQTPDTSYNVFVHLEREGGRIWAQSDSVPAGWTRPTTGWVEGEFIVDEHRLALPDDLPAGAYTLFVGLYEPQSGARVTASGPGATADGRVAIGEFVP
jgi:hypothetical protein